MWLLTIHLALLSFMVFFTSSVSANNILADKILNLEAECNFYIRQTDNAILDEGGDMFPMNPGEDYFKCISSLDNLKRQYIMDNLLGLCLNPETFPMQLSNGTVLMVLAPPEEVSDSPTKSPDFSHLEEMCIIHKTCSRILDDLLESIASKKDSEINYFKIKRFYCSEILEKLQMKYIKENNMNVDLLKALGELTVLCQEGRTSMSLPKPLKDRDIPTSASSVSNQQADSTPTKNSENNDLNIRREPMNGALYNEIDAKVHTNQPVISKSTDGEGSRTPLKDSPKLNEEEIANSGETKIESAKVDSRNSRKLNEEEIPNSGETGIESAKVDSINSPKLNEEEISNSGETGLESAKVDSRNDNLSPLASKKRVPDLDDISPRIPVEASLLAPEMDNIIGSNNNWETASSQKLDEGNKKSPVTYDELEKVSFQMKAVAADFNAISNLVTSPQVSVRTAENIDDLENNRDSNLAEANGNPDVNNDDIKTKLKVDSDKVNTNDEGIRQSNDQTVDSSSDHEMKDDKVESDDDIKTKLKVDTDKVNTNDDAVRQSNDQTVDSSSEDEMKDDKVESDDDDINKNSDTFIDNVDDANNSNDKIIDIDDKVIIDDEKTITDKFIKNEKSYSGNDMVKIRDSSASGKADNVENNDDKVTIDMPDVSSDSPGSSKVESGTKTGEVVSVAGSSSKSTSPGVMNDNSGHTGPMDSALSDDLLQLEEPGLDYSPTTTETPIADILGDELFKKEEDCKELLAVARQLLKHGSVSYLDDEYTDCLNKLDELKLLYIRKHGIDLEKHKTNFPVVLSTGTVELLSLPPLEGESLTALNIQPAPDSQVAAEDVFRGSEGLNDESSSDKKVRPPFNPILISNEKFLEYFKRKVPSD